MQLDSMPKPSYVHMRTRDRRINLMIAVEVLHIGGAEVIIQRLAQTIDQGLFNLTICCMKVRGSIGD